MATREAAETHTHNHFGKKIANWLDLPPQLK
jgi:hypothetical protein